MKDRAVFHRAFGRRDAPLPRGGSNEHFARDRADDPCAVEAVADRRGTAGDLLRRRLDDEIEHLSAKPARRRFGEAVIGRQCFAPDRDILEYAGGRARLDAHLVETAAEFLGREGRNAGKGALPHFRLARPQRHDAVSADVNPVVQEGAAGVAGPGDARALLRQLPCADADQESERAGADQNRAAGGDKLAHCPASAARWIAARMRP